MKFSGSAVHIAKAVTLAAGVAPMKDERPIIQNMAFIAENDEVHLLATDLIMSVRIKIPEVSVFSDGNTLVNAKLAARSLNKFNREHTTVQTVKAGCRISIKGTKYTIRESNYYEYPKIERFSDKPGFKIPVSVLKNMIRKTAFAAAKQERTYAMHGILLEIQDNVLRFVTTNGKRLAIMEHQLEGTHEDDAVVLPKKHMEKVFKLIANAEDEAEVQLNETSIGIKTNEIEIILRLLEGKFPPYRQVMPSTFEKTLVLPRKDFLEALAKTEVLITPASNIVRLDFNKDGLDFISSSAELGDTVVSFDLGDQDYEHMIMGYNPDALIEGLKVMQSEDFKFKLNGPSAPALLEETDDGLSYVAVPVRLQ